MKKTHLNTIIAALLLGVAALTSGCAKDDAAPAPGSDFTAAEMVASVINSQTDIPAMDALMWDDDSLGAYLDGYYGVDIDALADGTVSYAGGLEVSEISVLQFDDEKDAADAEAALDDYIASRVADFTGYAPKQAEIAEDGKVIISGRYAALIICADPDAAEAAFLACFDDDATPPDALSVFAQADIDGGNEGYGEGESPDVTEPDTQFLPEVVTPDSGSQGTDAPVIDAPDPIETDDDKQDVYDSGSVLSAWQSGDASALSGKNLTVYTAAVAVIDELITDDMDTYDIELAIHDYIITSCEYDPNALSHAVDSVQTPDNDNPYGALTHGQVICLGYSTTFQLFMDMLEIECITVPGTANAGEDHAWNMVRLDDGEWYCVDVTWDDPVGGRPSHTFFNVTSSFMKLLTHRWDVDSVPDATATAYAYKG